MNYKIILKLLLLTLNIILITFSFYYKKMFFLVASVIFFFYFLWLFKKWKNIKQKEIFKLRAYASTDIILFFIIILTLRLIQIQIFDMKDYRKIVSNQIEGFYQLSGKRGKIFDRNGKELAFNLKGYNLYIDPKRIIKNNYSKKAIKEIFKTFNINKDYNKFMAQVEMEGKKERRFKKIYSNLNENENSKLEKILKKYRISQNEIFTKETSLRKYYNEENYKKVIGKIGYSDKEGRIVGVYGIEKYYENYLKEKKIIKKSIFAKNRKLILPMAKEEMNINLDGKNLFLTIDNDLQYILNDEMKKKFEETNSEEAYAIIVNPNNGEILALSDLNRNSSVLRNEIFQNQIEPGSIFKPIIMSAAFNDKYVNKESTFDIEDGKIVKYNHTIKEASQSTKGILSLKEILAKSSNVAMVKLSDLFDDKKMEEYLVNFGFYSKTNVDFPFEKKPYTTSYKKWDGLKKNTISFGQGIAVTPVQMIMAFSALVNGGKLYKPFLVEKITDNNNIVIRRNLPITQRNPINNETSNYMKELLENVVENGGGVHSKLKGYKIGGKTGTAQISGGKSGYIKGDYLTSFVGIFPSDKPEYVGLITFYKPNVQQKYGGIVAAPVFKEVIKRLTMNKEILSSEIKKIEINNSNYLELNKNTEEKNETKELNVMPDLKGLTAREAIHIFENENIKFNIIGTGLIKEFSPKKDTKLENIKSIDLILE